MSSSDYSTDGALGNNSFALNPLLVPGVMRGLAINTTVTNPPLGNLIASSEDFSITSPNNRFYVDDVAGGASYYSFNGSTITTVQTKTATFVKGLTDMVAFGSHFYISDATPGTNKLVQWDGVNAPSESFKSFANSQTGLWHPMFVKNGLLYVGDGNLLRTLAADESTGLTTVQTYAPNELIVAIGLDPATGLLLISVSTTIDKSDTIPSKKLIYMTDGVEALPRRRIPVDDLVTAFYNVEGIVYCGVGLSIGMWNGQGITYLRKLYNATASNADLPYKHNFSNVRNFLLVADGQTLLAYGEVIAGKRAWFNTGYAIGTNHITSVSPTGTSRIGIAFANSGLFNLRVFDFAATSASCVLNFNNIYYPRPIFVRRVRVIMTGVTTTVGDGSVSIIDEKGTTWNTAVNTMVVPAAQSPKYVFDYDFTSLALQGLQLSVNTPSQATGFVRAIIYYDPKE